MSRNTDDRLYRLESIVRKQTEASWQMLLALKDLIDEKDRRIVEAREHLLAADKLLRELR